MPTSVHRCPAPHDVPPELEWTAGFVPGSSNRIASPTTTHFTDSPGARYFYKLTAIDTHDNESAPTARAGIRGCAGSPR